jgi:predicted ribosomally synthesized peptide with nif11-like leader
MSTRDVERFVADLKTDPGLFEEVKNAGGGLSNLISIAESRGYEVSATDAEAYLEGRARGHLSDSELGLIAAGKGKGGTTTSMIVASAVAGGVITGWGIVLAA